MSTENAFYWFALSAAIAANISANLSLKIAMSSLNPSNGSNGLLSLLQMPMLWVGLVSALLLLSSYLVALRVIPVGLAYVMVTSLALIGITIGERVVFGTEISGAKIVGVLLVLAGIWLISRPA